MSINNSDEYIKYRINRANETIQEVQTHIENKFWNTAINRLYYACFYLVTALLYKHKIVTKSHSGVRQMFGKYFVKTGKIERELAKYFTELFEKRHSGDYNDFYDYDEKTVLRLFQKPKIFIQEITKLINNLPLKIKYQQSCM